jgi:hypothetical protein
VSMRPWGAAESASTGDNLGDIEVGLTRPSGDRPVEEMTVLGD